MTSAAETAIYINADDVRQNHPAEWFPLVMLCADPTFNTISAEARDYLAGRDLIQLTADGGYTVHDMIRDVVLRMG